MEQGGGRRRVEVANPEARVRAEFTMRGDVGVLDLACSVISRHNRRSSVGAFCPRAAALIDGRHVKVRVSRSEWAEVSREKREPRVLGPRCEQGSAGQLVKTVIL